MVMLAADQSITTVEQLLALPEDHLRHELLRGEHVVTLSAPRVHQYVSAELSRRLGIFTVGLADLTTYTAPADVRVGLDSLVQPDIFVVRDARGPLAHDLRQLEVPLLVVEILSPGTAARDRGKKREIYLEAGVGEYWIVDIDARAVEVWRPTGEKPEIFRELIPWKPNQDGASLTIDLVDVFRGIGER